MKETGRTEGKKDVAGWTIALLPTLLVLLFYLLKIVLPVPHAAGVSFLMAALIAYRLAPRTRVRVLNLAVGILLAALSAMLLSALLAR
jgi:hypothetical protein